MSSGLRSRSPAAAAGDEGHTAAAAVLNNVPSATTLSHEPAAPPSSDASPVPHPHMGLMKDGAPQRLDQPLTATVAASMPRRSWARRVAIKVMKWDRDASTYMHRASLFPFDLFLVPFAMMCGSYGMPFLIPLLALVESPRLAVQVLASTLLTAIFTTLGKRSTKRLRPAPDSLARKFFNLRRFESNFSFPSGDSAQGAVVGVNLTLYAMALVTAKLAAAAHPHTQLALAVQGMPPLVFLSLLPLVMTSRVYFGAHWWSDTLGGIVFGGLCTGACWAMVPGWIGWHPSEVGGRDWPLLQGVTPIMQILGFSQPGSK